VVTVISMAFKYLSLRLRVLNPPPEKNDLCLLAIHTLIAKETGGN
jgi:hypothetical protein